MRFIPDWKQALKMFSVQAILLSGAVLWAWEAVPPDLKQLLPARLGTCLVSSVLLLGILGRLVDQEGILWAWWKPSKPDNTSEHGR